MPSPRTSVLSALAALSTALVGGLVAAQPAQAVDTGSPVVISEVYGGGGNNGAPFSNDFIELYNNGTTAVDLTGWSVQYGSATGSTWAATPLSGSIAPGAYYLVQEAAGTTPSTPLPTPDATGTLSMAGASGKVALSKTATALTCGSTCSTAAGVVDFVGYGVANDSAGGHPTPALGNTTSAQRRIDPFANTGDNAADFTVATPTPKAAPVGGGTGTDCSVQPLPPACVPGTTTIQDVQGSGFLSTMRGDTVDKVPGIVTGVRVARTGSGFWIQDPSPDTTRPSASSGVFVYSQAPVSVGDSVLVTGKVSDFYTLSTGESVTTTSNLSVTELTPTLVTTVSKGNPLPAALDITPTTVPDTYAPTVASGNVEDIATLDPSRSALEFWEAHEGMLVKVDDARVVGPGKTQYGEIYVTTKPEELRTPRGGTYIASYTKVPTGRLLVMPVNNVVPAANVGDVLTGTTQGPVDWSTFGGYDIAATQLGAYQDNHLAPTTASPQAADPLAVGTYNVENLAPGDPASKYATLGAGVVTNLKSPDVISVEEIQDNTGSTDDGVVAADQTLTKLTAAITAAGGPAYTWAEIDPVNDQDGGQPGGNIRSVFLYNPDRVTFVDKPAGDATTAVTVSAGADGTPDLSLNPGRIDPTNTAWTDSRKPLAGEFVFQGAKVIVVANHLNSKGGDQNADGRFQPPTRTSEVQRTQQATVLNTFVKQVLATDAKANIVLAGDFNDYQFSGPIRTLTDDGATLTDLINTLPENERYTYNYNGISQVLDHIFLSKAIKDVQYDVVHVNSEFAVQSSDHDPQVARLRFAPAQSTQGTIAVDPASVRQGGTTQVTLAGWDPAKTLTLALDGTTVGTATTGSDGGATFTLTIPTSAAAGTHTVSATTSDAVSASTLITVTAAIKLGMVKVSPNPVVVRKRFTAKLVDFAPNTSFTVSFEGQAVSVITNKRGVTTATFTVAASTTAGKHDVVVSASDGGQVTEVVRVRRK